MDLKEYDFDLPKELIAREPSEPRDRARLFVYRIATDEIVFDMFANLANYLPHNARLFINTTKVLPARVVLTKETGGRVELLFLMNEVRVGDEEIPVIADRRLHVGSKVSFPDGSAFRVSSQDEQKFMLRPEFPIVHIGQLLDAYGVTPIPKYIGGTPLDEQALRARYQSVFAERAASVAAPTASLHFTPQVFESLAAHGVSVHPLMLHVGMGTFAPVRPEHIAEDRLHKEWYEVPDATRRALCEDTDRPIIAVGTTVTRTLESLTPAMVAHNGVLEGSTELFIHPPFHFRYVRGMITNFHIPQSSLICLADAFLKDRAAPRAILDLYAIAIRERFRFYSFGDAMLLI